MNQSEANQSKVDEGYNGTSTENDDAENASSLEESTTESFMSNSTLMTGFGGLILLILAESSSPAGGKVADARTHPSMLMGRCIRPATREPGTSRGHSKSACHRLLHQPSSGIGSHGAVKMDAGSRTGLQLPLSTGYRNPH